KKGNGESIKCHPEIKISKTDNGSHGDNIGGLIGFNSVNDEKGRNFINVIMAKSMTEKTELRTKQYELKSTSLSDNPKLKLRVLTDTKNVISAFPYLKTNYQLPYSTKEIIEWEHMNKCEAEIKGGGRNTFGFDFFPTDYAVNKSKYIQNKEIQLKVSAIAFVVDKIETNQNTEVQFSEDFVSYMPSSNLPRLTYYDFIGKVIEFEEANIDGLNNGYIAKVKLINEDADLNFFTIDMFMNKENMRISSLEKGMKISGLLWFQGEIANE
ncbi:MAG: hypothetical protein ACI9P5_003480, partial [Saprospiraceae bacterium]